MVFLKLNEVAARCRVSPMTIRRWWASGHIIPPVKINGTLRWKLADLEAWEAEGCPAVDKPTEDTAAV